MTEVNLEDVSSVFLSESSTEIRKRMKSGELKIACLWIRSCGVEYCLGVA